MNRRHNPRQSRTVTVRSYVAVTRGQYHPCVFALTFIMLWGLLLPSARAQQAPHGPTTSLPPKLQPLFRKGVQALRAGDLKRAGYLFNEVLQQGGKAAFVYNNLGIVYQQLNEHQKAITEFREASRFDARYEAPHVLMGASLLALGKVSDAIRELERAVTLAPEEPRARFELGRAYMRGNQPLKAAEQFQVARRVAPQNSEYAYQLGMAYLNVAQWCVARIRQKAPKSARLYQIMAGNYRAQGQLGRAKTALEVAARADPSLPGVHLEIATIDLQQGDAKGARKQIEKELAIVPESASALALKHRLEEASK